jgi:hypothetical protein
MLTRCKFSKLSLIALMLLGVFLLFPAYSIAGDVDARSFNVSTGSGSVDVAIGKPVDGDDARDPFYFYVWPTSAATYLSRFSAYDSATGKSVNCSIPPDALGTVGVALGTVKQTTVVRVYIEAGECIDAEHLKELSNYVVTANKYVQQNLARVTSTYARFTFTDDFKALIYPGNPNHGTGPVVNYFYAIYGGGDKLVVSDRFDINEIACDIIPSPMYEGIMEAGPSPVVMYIADHIITDTHSHGSSLFGQPPSHTHKTCTSFGFYVSYWYLQQ